LCPRPEPTTGEKYKNENYLAKNKIKSEICIFRKVFSFGKFSKLNFD